MVEFLLGALLVAALAAAGIALGKSARSLQKLAEAGAKLERGEAVQIPFANCDSCLGKIARTLDNLGTKVREKENLNAEEENMRLAAEQQTSLERSTLEEFKKSVGEAITSFASFAGDMRKDAESMVEGAEKENNQAISIAASSEQASSSVQAVALAAAQLSEAIGEINRQIGDSAKMTDACATESEKTGSVMGELEQAVGNIGAVATLIEGIASQVNLLALNATIEAARAGEAGKGFAVVANEVKNLANQTGDATKDITCQINAVQEKSRNAVVIIKGVNEAIGRINEIFTAIAAATEEQGAAIQEIARNAQQASQGTSEVTGNISMLSLATCTTGTVAAQVLGTAETLTTETTELQKLVEQFMQKLDGGSTKSEQIAP